MKNIWKFDIDADTFWEAFGRAFLFWGITLFVVGMGVNWFRSCKKASVFDMIHGANYSCSDFFWAADQINAQTQTINLNSAPK